MKNLGNCETALENTENNLEKLQVILAQLNSQHKSIETSCDKISQVREQVRDMQR